MNIIAQISDKEVALEYIAQGNSLSDLSKELRADKDIFLLAVDKSFFSIQYASPELFSDYDTMLPAII